MSQPRGNFTTYAVPRLREMREAEGWTQAHLARRIGCATLSVSEWERGRRMTYRNLLRLAAAFGLPPAEIADYPLPPHAGRPPARPKVKPTGRRRERLK